MSAADPAYLERVILARAGPDAFRAEAARVILARRRRLASSLVRCAAVGALAGVAAISLGWLREATRLDGRVEAQAVAAPGAGPAQPRDSAGPAVAARLGSLGAPAASGPSPTPGAPAATAPSPTIGAPAASARSGTPTEGADVALDAPCGGRVRGAITAESAEAAIGTDAVVEFRVVAARDTGRVTYLNSHDPYAGHFYVAIFPDDYAAFPAPPAEFLLQRCVVVRGHIETYRDTAQVVVQSPDDLRIVGD